MQQQQFESENDVTRISAPRRAAKADQHADAEPDAVVLTTTADADTVGVPKTSHLASDTSQLPASQAYIEQLLKVIEQEATKRKRYTHTIARVYIGIVSLSLLAVLLKWIATGHFPVNILSYLGGFAGVGSIAAGFSKTQKSATKQIAEFEDVRAVGPMIEVLSTNDLEITRVVVPALTRLLPRLQAGDAHLLNAEQRAGLNLMLMTKLASLPVNIPDFYEAVLKALQQVGDETALPVVEKLAHKEGMAAYYPGLRAQAEETLPFLRQRIEQARASQTLLRASSAAEEAAPDTLLRAATPTISSDDPHQLLRADIQKDA